MKIAAVVILITAALYFESAEQECLDLGNSVNECAQLSM